MMLDLSPHLSAAALTTTLVELIGLAIAALIARRARTTARGMLAGVAAGLAVIVALNVALGFLAAVLPLGQLHFWFWSRWMELTGR